MEALGLAALVAWHPRAPRVGAAGGGGGEGRVRVLDLERRRARGSCVAAKDCVSISLGHERQTGVRCLGWRPGSGQSLAVGGQFGVCLWNISTRPVFQNSIAIGKSNEISSLSASLTFLRTDGPVTSLAWSANGRLLATICEGSSVIQVWDPALGSLRQLPGGGDLGEELPHLGNAQLAPPRVDLRGAARRRCLGGRRPLPGGRIRGVGPGSGSSICAGAPVAEHARDAA